MIDNEWCINDKYENTSIYNFGKYYFIDFCEGQKFIFPGKNKGLLGGTAWSFLETKHAFRDSHESQLY